MNDSNDEENKSIFATLWGFVILAILVIAIWGLNFVFMPIIAGQFDKAALAASGTAGDMFGGITALFSGLAFAGLVTTLFMQKSELELQRKELRQTREVFSIQRFENTFFGMIELLSNHVQSIETENIGPVLLSRESSACRTYTGRDALERIARSMPHPEEIIKNRDSHNHRSKIVSRRDKTAIEIIKSYEELYEKELEIDLGPYFRLIYNILRLIENAKFSDDYVENENMRLSYSKILRAHLNSSEIRLLLFNCLSTPGAKLLKWVEKYSLLKHISQSDYAKYSILIKEYEPSAFSL